MVSGEAIRWVLYACALPLLIAGCQTTPTMGSSGRVEVFEVPRQRQALHTNQQVSEGLEVFEAEIRQQRLVNIFCVIPDPAAYNGERPWHGMVILPNREGAKEGDTGKPCSRSNSRERKLQEFGHTVNSTVSHLRLWLVKANSPTHFRPNT